MHSRFLPLTDLFWITLKISLLFDIATLAECVHFGILDKDPEAVRGKQEIFLVVVDSKVNIWIKNIQDSCNERYGTWTTTLSSRNQRTALMQKIIKLYTCSHNYSNTEVRRTTNSLNPMMVFDNMHEHLSHLSFHKQRKKRQTKSLAQNKKRNFNT